MLDCPPHQNEVSEQVITAAAKALEGVWRAIEDKLAERRQAAAAAAFVAA